MSITYYGIIVGLLLKIAWATGGFSFFLAALIGHSCQGEHDKRQQEDDCSNLFHIHHIKCNLRFLFRICVMLMRKEQRVV